MTKERVETRHLHTRSLEQLWVLVSEFQKSLFAADCQRGPPTENLHFILTLRLTSRDLSADFHCRQLFFPARFPDLPLLRWRYWLGLRIIVDGALVHRLWQEVQARICYLSITDSCHRSRRALQYGNSTFLPSFLPSSGSYNSAPFYLG